MSQCVPSWDLDDAPFHSHSNSLPPHHVPSLDYEVAELTWENGQLGMHGLGPPRPATKPPPASWEKPRPGSGTLESLVNQATTTNNCHVPQLKSNGLAPLFDQRRPVVYPGAGGVIMDALVPCNNHHDHPQAGSRHVGSRAGMCSCKTNVSVSESTGDIAERRQSTAIEVGGERELGDGGLWSPENTSSGKDYTKTTSGDDHDSVCHSLSQKEGREDSEVRKNTGNEKSSVLTKRSRAAASHNQSERKRRDKINQRMKTLQKLVPNSSKTDKASILDEVIEYLKQLQAQVQMMSRMNIPQMMLPFALQQQQQQLQMSMMGMGMGMGMGVLDFNTLGRVAGMQPMVPPQASGMPPMIPPAAAFMPMASWDMQGDRNSTPHMPDLLSTLLACQSQPTTMEAYGRLAALYQQLQQGPGLGSSSGSDLKK